MSRLRLINKNFFGKDDVHVKENQKDTVVKETVKDVIKNKVKDTDIIFNLLPKYFTLGELQRNYEVILGKKLLDPAFRRIIKDKVIKTDKIRSDGGHRPSILYTYKEDIK